MFFPQLVSGPIVRHRQLIPQIYRRPFSRFSVAFCAVGISYFGIGVAKKVLIADPLDGFNGLVFANMDQIEPVEAWLNAFAYSFKIYFDFSAYADMAVGLGYIFGIQLPRNFNSPYKATNIAQFWRIWHISLHNFFKRYVYEEFLRSRFLARRIGLVIVLVMLLSAVWHGVGWGYLLWGAGHAALLLAYRWGRRTLLRRWRGQLGPVARFAWRWFARAALFLAVTLLWVPFALNDVDAIGIYFDRMFDLADMLNVSNLPLASLTDLVFIALAAAIVFFAPNSHQISLGHRQRAWPIFWGALLIAASLQPIWRQTADPVPFVYFQF